MTRDRRIVTVLFADVVGFTALSERFDPEDIATIQDRLFARVRGVLERHDGRIEKFIGDAVVAVFGVPKTHDGDARRGLRAGLALHDAVASLDAELGLPEGTLVLRVGLNTGEVAYEPETDRVTGDAINVAARLEAAAAPGTVLIGEQTALAVADVADLEPVGSLDLKGKTGAVRAWRAVGLRAEPSRDAALGALGAPTIGRDPDLTDLEDIFRALTSSSSRVLVVAPPGLGKSRLVDELARRLRDQDAATPVWRAQAESTRGAFHIVVQLLAQSLQTTAADLRSMTEVELSDRLRGSGVGAADEVLEQVVDLLAGAARGGTGGEREARFGAWLTALHALEHDRTALWVVEDVHEAGPDGRAFLDAATARGRRLIVATARPELLTQTPQWCEPDGTSTRLIHLDRLPDGAVRELIAAHVQDALPDELIATIVARADGNPLFVEELFRTWLSTGMLRGGPDGFALDRRPNQVDVPLTVRALYEAQLDELPPSGRRVAQLGAVVGRDFSVAALHALSPETDDAGLAILAARALIDGPFQGDLGDAYVYRHAVLQETAYNTLPRSQRADLHVRLASWLASTGRTDIAAGVAHHLTSALTVATTLATDLDGVAREEVRRRAASWRIRAARHALVGSAYATALAHLEALDIPIEDETGLAAAEAGWIRGSATAALGDLDSAADALEDAVERLERHLDLPLDDGVRTRVTDGYARAIERLATVRFDQLRFDTAAEIARRGLDRLGEAPDPVRARLMLVEGRAVGGAIGSRAADEVKERTTWATGVARSEGYLELRLSSVWALSELGMLDDGDADVITADAEDAARRLGRWSDYLQLRAIRTFDTLVVDSGEARRLAYDDIELTRHLGLATAGAWASYRVAEVETVCGSWSAACAAAEEALAAADAHEVRRAGVRTWFVLAPIATARDDAELLEGLRAWFGVPAERASSSSGSEYGRVMLAGTALHTGPVWHSDLPPPSIDDLRMDFGMPSWFLAREALIRTWIDGGRLDDAAAAVGPPPQEAAPPLEVASGRLVEAWVRLAEGGEDAAAAAARRALDGARACGAPWWAARAIRVLEAAEVASAAEVDERRRLEASLGVRRPQGPPSEPRDTATPA